MIFYSFTLLLFSVVFCFILFFQVLVYPSNVRNGFHHVEWTLSQIRYWLASSVRSTLPLHWHILKAGQIFRSNVLQLDWCSHFFPDSLQSTFTYQRPQNIGVKVNCSHMLDYPIINDVYCLQKWDSTVSFQRVTHCIRNSLSCFRDFHGTFYVNSLTECNPVLYCKPQLVMRDGQLRFCILMFRRSQQDSFPIFWAVSTALGFNFILPIALHSSCLFPHSLSLLYLFSSSSPDQFPHNHPSIKFILVSFSLLCCAHPI